ncbi:putative ATPase, V0 complex, c/d subunit [Medicago truncatula]|uniref:Putative ATPase, V0 complex, c/d subunit n=1 Tax=Medicago truncatula TaxID=3880 RepID=A0A396GZC9_MEDTR|nr:putative ATPase, V0 complex, c/d subunit [Medicago truncatula]
MYVLMVLVNFQDLDDMNIKIMRNTLYKAYLEDFYRFCQKLGGATAEIMSDLLAFEADRRAVNITITCCLCFPSFNLCFLGWFVLLWKNALLINPSLISYRMERVRCLTRKEIYEEEVKKNCLAFEQQFHYVVFFAYMRLREQEIRNLMWISECVAQHQKSRVHDSVVFIF